MTRFEAAVVALPTDEAGLNEIPLYDEDFVLAVPAGHRLDGRTGLPLSVLKNQPLLLLDDGHCLRDQTLDLCRSVDAAPRSSDTRAASLATIVQCVAGDLGLTLIPRSAIAVETARGTVGTAEFADHLQPLLAAAGTGFQLPFQAVIQRGDRNSHRGTPGPGHGRNQVQIPQHQSTFGNQAEGVLAIHQHLQQLTGNASLSLNGLIRVGDRAEHNGPTAVRRFAKAVAKHLRSIVLAENLALEVLTG